jgi:clan AA aspartic protease
MNGHVDSAGRALVRIALRTAAHSEPIELDAWIDTAFTGDLVLPQTSIASLGLRQSGTAGAVLGDGTTTVMQTYSGLIHWFGMDQEIEIVANNGQIPLLGVGLLCRRKLSVDCPGRTVMIE